MDKTKIYRTFSESFKRAKVAEIDSGKIKVSDIVRIYGVRDNNVRKWIKNILFPLKPVQEWSLNWNLKASKQSNLLKK
jgi:uncharacterized protein YjcR